MIWLACKIKEASGLWSAPCLCLGRGLGDFGCAVAMMGQLRARRLVAFAGKAWATRLAPKIGVNAALPTPGGRPLVLLALPGFLVQTHSGATQEN